jgi:hypothetical protein
MPQRTRSPQRSDTSRLNSFLPLLSSTHEGRGDYLHGLHALEHMVSKSDFEDNAKFWDRMEGITLPMLGIIRAQFSSESTARVWTLYDTERPSHTLPSPWFSEQDVTFT